MSNPVNNWRWLIGLASASGLFLVFIFQRWDAAAFIGIQGANIIHFLFNRTIRFFVNDALAIGLIFGLFGERKYVLVAVVIQIAGMLLFLLPYFIIKINFPAYNGPLVSFLHRLVLNPTLLLLLIPAFYYQRWVQSKPKK